MAYANILDCRLIRVFTGKVKSSEVTAKQYQQAVQGLKEICRNGKKYGITYALETHDNSLMDTSDATLKLIESVGCDNLKVNLQVPLNYGHEDIFESALRLKDHTIHVHAHNWHGDWSNLTYLKDGDYNFVYFIDILKTGGFDGYISIEHADHHGKHDVMDVLSKEIKYLHDNILFGL